MIQKPEGYHEDLYLEHLQRIADGDVQGLKAAQRSYGNSWKSRGGPGAFHMFARKWDRFVNRVKRPIDLEQRSQLRALGQEVLAKPENQPVLREKVQAVLELIQQLTDPGHTQGEFDIFAHVFADRRAEGVIDDIRDLRRYLLLAEAEIAALGFDAVHRDNRADAV